MADKSLQTLVHAIGKKGRNGKVKRKRLLFDYKCWYHEATKPKREKLSVPSQDVVKPQAYPLGILHKLPETTF